MSITDIMDEKDVEALIGSLANLSRGFYQPAYVDGTVVEQMAEAIKVQEKVGESIASGLRDIASSVTELAEAINDSKV